MMRFSIASAVVVVVLANSAYVTADDTSVPQETIDRWVQELDADEFPVRKAAEAALLKTGTAAVDALQKGAESGDRELALRCLDLLSRLVDGANKQAQEPAKKALEHLAKSDDPVIAQRAGSKLEEPPPVNQLRNPLNAVVGNVVIQGGLQRQVQVTNVNGQRTIKATENGKTVEIEDRDGKDITVRVTEEKAGKSETKTYEAKDVAELKEKHPDAAKLYEEYTQQPAGIQVQFQFNGGAIQGLRGPPVNPRRTQQNAQSSIETALDDLAEVRKQINALKEAQSVEGEELQKLLDRVSAAEKSLFEAQSALE